MTDPVALITGVGEGTGAALAHRFSEGRYRVAMVARNHERLQALETELSGATAYGCDISDVDALMRTVDAVRADLGAPSVLVHNAVRANFETFLKRIRKTSSATSGSIRLRCCIWPAHLRRPCSTRVEEPSW